MKIEHWKHENVDEDGGCHPDLTGLEELEDSNMNFGSVVVEPSITMSSDNGGCGLEHCQCSEGHWLCLNFGRDSATSTVSGVTVKFDNYGEMAIFLSTRKLVSEKI